MPDYFVPSGVHDRGMATRRVTEDENEVDVFSETDIKVTGGQSRSGTQKRGKETSTVSDGEEGSGGNL
jgi:hypothetical protein